MSTSDIEKKYIEDGFPVQAGFDEFVRMVYKDEELSADDRDRLRKIFFSGAHHLSCILIRALASATVDRSRVVIVRSELEHYGNMLKHEFQQEKGRAWHEQR